MLGDVRRLLAGRAPGQLVVQITDRCNAACPQCGMRVGNRYERATLPERQVEELLAHAADLGISAVSFTGGEPLLVQRELRRYVARATRLGIRYTRTGTNGFVFAGRERAGWQARVTRLAAGLSAAGLRNLWISLDSADPTRHETQRGLPGVIAGIERALPILHEHGVYPAANLALNRAMGARPLPALDPARPDLFAEAALTAATAFFRRAVDLGFTMANVCYPMSVEPAADGTSPVYAATSADTLVRFTAAEKIALYRAVAAAIAALRGEIRIFTPLSSIEALARDQERRVSGAGNEGGEAGAGGDGQAPSYACRGGVDYFFVAATGGHVFPCGFRGDEDLGPFVDLRRRHAERPSCRACDWECFRDPSQLFGPVLAARAHPLRCAHTLLSGRAHMRTWLDDVGYARRCDLFDGRRPPRRRRPARPPASR